MSSSFACRSLVTVLGAVLATGALLAGCTAGSSAGVASSSAPVVSGATCPDVKLFGRLTASALGAGAEQTYTRKPICDGEWSAATFTVDDEPGRAALKWDGATWTPVLVGGAEGACPATVKAAPDDIKEVLGC